VRKSVTVTLYTTWARYFAGFSGSGIFSQETAPDELYQTRAKVLHIRENQTTHRGEAGVA
jgi:hypothetical protein